jgi:hypothetical protein
MSTSAAAHTSIAGRILTSPVPSLLAALLAAVKARLERRESQFARQCALRLGQKYGF